VDTEIDMTDYRQLVENSGNILLLLSFPMNIHSSLVSLSYINAFYCQSTAVSHRAGVGTRVL